MSPLGSSLLSKPLSSLSKRKSSLLISTINKRTFSSSQSASQEKSASTTSKSTTTTTANIIQGPSLLTSTGKHRPAPSLFHLPGLRSLPFWTSKADNKGSSLKVAYNDPIITSIVSLLESNVELITAEYEESIVAQKTPSDYDITHEDSSGALHTGKWEWHSYIQKGVKSPLFPLMCPHTTAIINEIGPHLFSSTPFSFCFFSTLNPKSSIKPHYGPMNLRLRIHLPLITPEDKSSCGMRVANQMRSFHKGKAIVLDDSYEHEVWNTSSTDKRVTLAVDIWHPDVDLVERHRIQDMFRFATEQGWIGNKAP